MKNTINKTNNEILINWSDKLNIGNTVIDEQHKLFLQLVNEFYSALIAGKAKEKIAGTIKTLQNYSQNHLKAETAFLEKIKYPEIKEHIHAHKTFKITINDIEKRHKSCKNMNTLAFDIMSFMKNWFQNHIITSSKQMDTFIKKNK